MPDGWNPSTTSSPRPSSAVELESGNGSGATDQALRQAFPQKKSRPVHLIQRAGRMTFAFLTFVLPALVTFSSCNAHAWPLQPASPFRLTLPPPPFPRELHEPGCKLQNRMAESQSSVRDSIPPQLPPASPKPRRRPQYRRTRPSKQRCRHSRRHERRPRKFLVTPRRRDHLPEAIERGRGPK